MTKKESAFKMVIYFDQKQDNSYYTHLEKSQNRHIKRMGSWDIKKIPFKRSIKDERNAFNMQIRHLEGSIRGRYKTAFIVINNYKGYTIVVRKYVNTTLKIALNIKWMVEKNGSSKVMVIPQANDLIAAFEDGTINEYQSKLIKKYDERIMIANPYDTKYKKSA